MMQAMKVLRQLMGWVVGYGISLASSLAWFACMHRPPYLAQPKWYMVATAIYGFLFAILAGYVAARIGTYPTGFAVGVTIAVLSILSLLTDKGAHWSQYVSLVLMSPAAVLGAKLRVIESAPRFGPPTARRNGTRD
jgi:hypothetical protein